MLFSSLMFIFVFLPAVILVYYISPRKIRNIVLLVFSLFFYGYGEPKYLIIMLASITINYVMGLLVDRFRSDKFKSRLVIFAAILLNLSIIGYYKYSDFAIDNFNKLFNMSVPLLNIIMPIGISFFTFQGLSYVFDVYKGHGKVQKNPLNVALYISLFPQLIAGPIVRYETVAKQIESRKETLEGFSYGIERFIIGLSKKVLIANTIGLIADEIFKLPNTHMSVILSWIGIVSYTLQIYFDFSGYSDMAIGLGQMFGFKFLENFNYPYVSRSITEFWRRWHISLSTWFRDYVYIPLGGNRVGKVRLLLNILIVWFLTGLWHGAAWNFILWGLYYGLILIMEKLFLGKIMEKLPRVLQHIYTMLLVILGWLLFRADSFGSAMTYLSAMFGGKTTPFMNPQTIYYLVENKFILIIAIIACLPIIPKIKKRLENISTNWVKVFTIDYLKPIFLVALFLLCIMYLTNSTFNPFIYFRF